SVEDCIVQIRDASHFQDFKLHAQQLAGTLDGFHLHVAGGRIPKHSDLGEPRHGFLEHFQPFFGEVRKIKEYARDLASWPRETLDQAAGDGIGLKVKRDNRDGGACSQRSPHGRRTDRSDHIDIALGKLHCQRSNTRGVAVGCARHEFDIVRLMESGGLQSLAQSGDARCVAQCHPWIEEANLRDPGWLLRARRERPRCRAAEQVDELAPSHSIPSSAATSSLSGTVSPSIRAVWWLITSSNLLACTTGKSAGLAPLRMRPV